MGRGRVTERTNNASAGGRRLQAEVEQRKPEHSHSRRRALLVARQRTRSIASVLTRQEFRTDAGRTGAGINNPGKR